MIAIGRARSASIFPFGLGRQTILGFFHFRELAAKGIGVLPGHALDGTIRVFEIGRVRAHDLFILRLRDLVDAEVEGLRDVDLADWPLIPFAFVGTHQEGARLDAFELHAEGIRHEFLRPVRVPFWRVAPKSHDFGYR
jgi:hypothetical protein